MTELLWSAVDELVKPRHVKLWRDDGGKSWSEWTTVPSLWWQLVEAVASSSALDGGGHASRYRAPLDLECMELVKTVTEVVLDGLCGHDQTPRATVPDSVRALASVVVTTGDDDLIGWWTYRVRSWSRQISNALRLNEQPQPRRIRDTRCPTCSATHVTLPSPEGELMRVPALLIDFRDGLIQAASCSACGSTWFRGSALWELADATRPVTGADDLDTVC